MTIQYPADMTVILSRTYTDYTPESIDNGDISDSGFIYQDEVFTVEELRDMRDEFIHMSCSNPADAEWISTESYTTCYQTGTTRTESLHISDNANDVMYDIWLAFLTNSLVIIDNE